MDRILYLINLESKHYITHYRRQPIFINNLASPGPPFKFSCWFTDFFPVTPTLPIWTQDLTIPPPLPHHFSINTMFVASCWASWQYHRWKNAVGNRVWHVKDTVLFSRSEISRSKCSAMRYRVLTLRITSALLKTRAIFGTNYWRYLIDFGDF